MRRTIFVGNWKMNMLISSSKKLVQELICASDFVGNFDIIVAPSFTSISAVRTLIKGSRVQLAGQNMSSKAEGARTGEVSAAMLQDAGCDYVILGHSANPDQVQGVHYFLRSWCEKSYGKKMASGIRILYGGSVDSQCSSSLMLQPDIDGLLVGGASLKSKSFYDIINSSFETGD